MANQGAQTESRDPITLSLPKSGGAITGYGEAFTLSGYTGVLGHTVGGLSYSAAAGNGVFGMGFGTMTNAGIGRRTNHGTPTYNDDCDQFVVGSAVLVPLLDSNGSPVIVGGCLETVKNDAPWRRLHQTDNAPTHTDAYVVRKFKPRKEASFQLIEYWKKQPVAVARESLPSSFWRVVGSDNSVALFGVTPQARISNPNDGSQVYRWLPEEGLDPVGHSTFHTYVEENDNNLNVNRAPEIHHTQTGQRYVSRSYSGQDHPFPQPLSLVADSTFKQSKLDAFFSITVYDYGQYNIDRFQDIPLDIFNRVIDDSKEWNWPKRQDSFSSNISGFEIRTHRLCRHVLQFTRYPEYNFDFSWIQNYSDTLPLLHSIERYTYEQSPVCTLLRAVDGAGFYLRNDGSSQQYEIKHYPPEEYQYSRFSPEAGSYRPVVDGDSGQPLKAFRTDRNFQFVDLYGEGIASLLWSDGHRPRYIQSTPESILLDDKHAPITFELSSNSNPLPVNRLDTNGDFFFMDITGNGRLDCVFKHPGQVGYYQANEDGSWTDFKPLPFPPESFNIRSSFLDVTGNGRPDCIQAMGDSFRYYANNGEGFDPGVTVKSNLPTNIQTSETDYFGFADMTGDGRADLVHVTHSRCVYYMNKGYGVFSQMIEMVDFPDISYDEFRADRCFLVDLDGSGTSDLVLFTRDCIKVWMNASGNRFLDLIELPLPDGVTYDPLDEIFFGDLYGMGLPSLFYVKTHPSPKQYVYRFCSTKPYLMIQSNNNTGIIATIEHRSSVHYYLRDKQENYPWITRAPFPVWVTSSVTTRDEISKVTLHQKYWYRHNYYDGVEREYRGFGCVISQDAQKFDPIERETDSPPALTKTWYHVGAPDQHSLTKQYQHEFFQGDPIALKHQLPDSHINFNGFFDELKREGQLREIQREANMLMKGTPIRSEVYGLNDPLSRTEDDLFDDLLYKRSGIYTNSQIPFTVSENNVVARLLQPREENNYASYVVLAHESLALTYEQNAHDPQMTYSAVMTYDAYGHALQTVVIHYPRRSEFLPDGAKASDNPYATGNQYIAKEQSEIRIYTSFTRVYNLTNAAEICRATKHDDFYMLGIVYGRWSYRVRNHPTAVSHQSKIGLSDGEFYPWFQLKHFLQTLPQEVEAGTDTQMPSPEERYFLDGTSVMGEGPLPRYEPDFQLMSWQAEDFLYPLAGDNEREESTNYNHIKTIKLGRNTSRGTLLPSQSWVAAYKRVELLDKELLGHFFPTLKDLDRLMLPEVKGNYVLNTSNEGVSGPENAEFYWVRSGKHHYREWSAFYLPDNYVDPMGSMTTYHYDPHNLMVIRTVDALGNVTRILNIDYQLGQPFRLQDINDNTAEVVFDALGRVITSSYSGVQMGDDGRPAREGFDSLYDPSGRLIGYQLNNKTILPRPQVVLLNEEAYLQGASEFTAYYAFSWMASVSIDRLIDQGIKPGTAKRLLRLLEHTNLVNEEGAVFDRLKNILLRADGDGAELQTLLAKVSPDFSDVLGKQSHETLQQLSHAILNPDLRQPTHILCIIAKDYPNKSNAILTEENYRQAITAASDELRNHRVNHWWNALQEDELIDSIGVFSPKLRVMREADDIEAFGDQLANDYPASSRAWQAFNVVQQKEIYALMRIALRRRLREGIAYDDGFGRSIGSKIKADRGTECFLYDRKTGTISSNQQDNVIDNRWLTEGHKVYNNKGLIVREYDPYYINTEIYIDSEKLDRQGTTPTNFYDALNRVTHTITRKGFLVWHLWTAWNQTLYDSNDTVLLSPYFKVNKDVIAKTGQAPASEILLKYGTYYDPRMSDRDIDAYYKTFPNSFTPSGSIVDNQGLSITQVETSQYKFAIDAFAGISSSDSDDADLSHSETLFHQLVDSKILLRMDLSDVNPSDVEFGAFIVGPLVDGEGSAVWGVLSSGFPCIDVVCQLRLPDRYMLEGAKIINLLMAYDEKGKTLSVESIYPAFKELYQGRSPFDNYQSEMLWYLLVQEGFIGKRDNRVQNVTYPKLDLKAISRASNKAIVKVLVNGFAQGLPFERISTYDSQGRPVSIADHRLYLNGYWTSETCYPETVGIPPHGKDCDAGQTWAMQDAIGRPLWGVGPRGEQGIPEYDALHRPLTEEVSLLDIHHIPKGDLHRHPVIEATHSEAPQHDKVPRVIWGPFHVNRNNYGETAFSSDSDGYKKSQLYNFRGQTVQHFDQSAWYSVCQGYTILGQPIGNVQILTKAYKPSDADMKRLEQTPAYVVPPLVDVPPLFDNPDIPDDISWNPESHHFESLLQRQEVVIEGRVVGYKYIRYFTSAQYDATGTVIRTIDVDNNIYQLIFDKQSRPIIQYINGTPFINNVVYNAKGLTISKDVYSSPADMVLRSYNTYDAKNYRLTQYYTTTSPTEIVRRDEYQIIHHISGDTRQNLIYTFDPFGNVSEVDGEYMGPTQVGKHGKPLEEVQRVLFPSGGKYTYDPLNRLIMATGYEDDPATTELPPAREGLPLQ